MEISRIERIKDRKKQEAKESGLKESRIERIKDWKYHGLKESRNFGVVPRVQYVGGK